MGAGHSMCGRRGVGQTRLWERWGWGTPDCGRPRESVMYVAFGCALEHVPKPVLLYVRACVRTCMHTLCSCSRWWSSVTVFVFSSFAVARDRLKDLPVSSQPVQLHSLWDAKGALRMPAKVKCTHKGVLCCTQRSASLLVGHSQLFL